MVHITKEEKDMWWVLILGASIGGVIGAIGTVVFIVYGSKWVKGGSDD